MVLTNPRRDWDNKWHVVKVQGIQQTQLHSMNLIKEGLVCCRNKKLSCSINNTPVGGDTSNSHHRLTRLIVFCKILFHCSCSFCVRVI